MTSFVFVVVDDVDAGCCELVGLVDFGIHEFADLFVFGSRDFRRFEGDRAIT